MSQDLNRKTSQSVNFKDQWSNVLKKLNNEYGNEVFNSWIKNIKIESQEGEVIFFNVPTRFIRDWITSHYLDKIIFFLNSENPDIKRVKINIDNSLSSTTHRIEFPFLRNLKFGIFSTCCFGNNLLSKTFL